MLLLKYTADLYLNSSGCKYVNVHVNISGKQISFIIDNSSDPITFSETLFAIKTSSFTGYELK